VTPGGSRILGSRPVVVTAPAAPRSAAGEFFHSAFIRVVAGYVLLDWVGRRLTAWLGDRLYGVADFVATRLLGPAHHYADAGYPRLPEAVAMVVVPTALYWGFVRLTERRRVRELGGGRWGLLEGAGGLLLGAGLFTLVVLALVVAGAYHVVGRDEWTVVQWSLPAAAVAFREELLYRGVIQRVSEERLGTWLALVFASAWFGWQHVDNPNAGLSDGLMIALFGGVLLGACYLATRRLWLAIGVHAAWNLVEGGVFGTPVSGYAIPGWLRSTVTGDEWLTGGAFGPEASLVTLAVTSAASAALLVVAWRRGSLRPPRLRPTARGGTARA
jgi:membrane protease YdiL (CAAX protease family)